MSVETSPWSRHLVETEWLAANLAEPDLRVVDCTVVMTPTVDDPFRVESGRAAWERGHIPRSGFLDLQDDLSDKTIGPPLRYTMPSADQFADVMARKGVGQGTRVVLYSAGHPMWAARVWWMLRAFGFEEVAVLNGGWEKWVAEGRSISTESCGYPPGRFMARPRPELVVGKAEVLAAVGDPSVRLINALTRKQHAGEGVHYGRPGRIPGSACVPALMLVQRGTSTFQPLPALSSVFDAAAIKPGQRVITYCGAGVAAACDAFVLSLLGHENVAIYDGSLAEWSNDPSLPMETG